MPSVYRTALGKQVDIDKIRLLNEETVAVGNMRVNARGDSLDRDGQILQEKDERVLGNRPNKTYKPVIDEPIDESRSSVVSSRAVQQKKDNTAELQATIEQLQRQLEEKNNQLAKQSQMGKTLREAVADEPLNIQQTDEEVNEVLTPTKTDSTPARGGLAAAIQKNMELQAKKTKPKRI